MKEDKHIIEKLVSIVDKIKDEELESNVKLLQWSKRKFHTKVLMGTQPKHGMDTIGKGKFY